MGVLEEAQVADAHWRETVDAGLKELRARQDEHFERLERGDERMDRIESDIRENNLMTSRIEQSTKTLVEWAQNIIGFRNTVDWLAGVVIRLGLVLTALGLVWWAVATGQLPRKAEGPRAHDTAFALLESRRRNDIEGRRRRARMGGAFALGSARPAQPVSVFAEDFSLLIRTPRRLRIARSRIRVLS